MSLRRKFEDTVFGAIDPFMPEYGNFYILTENDLKEVRNMFAQEMEDNRDGFEVELGSEGVEWKVSDYDMAEEHLKAKAAYDALTILISRSYKAYKPEDFAEKHGGEKGGKNYSRYNISDTNMWSSLDLKSRGDLNEF